jgi:hypothetical protein
MVFDEMAIIHLVYVVTGEYYNIIGVKLLKMVQVLIDRVGCSSIPVFTDPHLRRKMGHEFPQFRVKDTPGVPCMFYKRVRFILRKNKDFSNTGIDTVAQSKIDNPVFSTKRDSGFCPVFCQRMQTNTNSTGKDKGYGIMYNL